MCGKNLLPHKLDSHSILEYFQSSQQSREDLIRIEFEALFNTRVEATSGFRVRRERIILNGIDRLVNAAFGKLNLHSASNSFSNDQA